MRSYRRSFTFKSSSAPRTSPFEGLREHLEQQCGVSSGRCQVVLCREPLPPHQPFTSVFQQSLCRPFQKQNQQVVQLGAAIFFSFFIFSFSIFFNFFVFFCVCVFFLVFSSFFHFSSFAFGSFFIHHIFQFFFVFFLFFCLFFISLPSPSPSSGAP